MLLLVDPQYGRDHDQRADVETSHGDQSPVTRTQFVRFRKPDDEPDDTQYADTETRNIRRPVPRTRFVRFSKPDDERELDDTQSDTAEEIGFTPQQLAHHQTSR